MISHSGSIPQVVTSGHQLKRTPEFSFELFADVLAQQRHSDFVNGKLQIACLKIKASTQ